MEKKYISVFALNKYIKAKMDQDISLQNIYIQGEISNYRPHPSGHLSHLKMKILKWVLSCFLHMQNN